MEPQNLTNQRRQLVIALLGGERFKISEERFPEPDHYRMRRLLGFEALSSHLGSARALPSQLASCTQALVERFIHFQLPAGDDLQGTGRFKWNYVRPFADCDPGYADGPAEPSAITIEMGEGIFLPHKNEGTP